MARYFFDFHDLHLSTRDEEGTECANPRAVSSEALIALCQVAEDQPERYADRGLNLIVRDSNNRTVLTACLNLSTVWHAEQGASQAA